MTAIPLCSSSLMMLADFSVGVRSICYILPSVIGDKTVSLTFLVNIEIEAVAGYRCAGVVAILKLVITYFISRK